MAGDWIPMRTDLWECPQVVQILSAICPQGADRVRAHCLIIGALWRTWSLFDSYSADGKLSGYTEKDLDDAVGMEGWSLNLQHVGWLIVEPQVLIMPEFEEWMSNSSKRRKADARRKRKTRENVSAKCPQAADKMRTTEEKRRVKNTPLTPLGGKLVTNLATNKTKPPTPEAVFERLQAALAKRSLPRPRKLTPDRRRRLGARLASTSWLDSLAAALQKLPIPGDGWQPDIDWLIANDGNVERLCEGKYDWRGNGEKPAKPYKPPSQRKSADEQLGEQRSAHVRKAKAAGKSEDEIRTELISLGLSKDGSW